MSGWQFSFPPSRTCLWDTTPTDSPCELHLTRSSWLNVRITAATLRLSLRHARHSRRKLFNCYLIATAWITDGEGIVIEVDRFDPGRPSADGSGLSPTTHIPGDLCIPTTLAVQCHPHSKHLMHNLESLHRSITTVKQSVASHSTPLDPSHLLSLKIHCTCSENDHLAVECVCVYPGLMVEATPIQSIPIVQTALARNLAGPLSLSAIQGRAKHGFVTMEAARKLVLLLHSDPKAATLPLVGVWVSGVSSVYHPVVWMACAMYSQSTSLKDRVWSDGRSFLVLVYLHGSTIPQLSNCVLKNDRELTECIQLSSGESSLSISSTESLVSFELYPVQESTALHTLLETVVTTTSEYTKLVQHQTRLSCDLMPLPSPQPTPTQVPPQLARDSELSMVSCLSDEGQLPSVALTPYTIDTRNGSPRGVDDDKENTPINNNPSTTERNEGAPDHESLTSPSAEESLIVFPDKLGVNVTPRSADTRRLLKQQETQLRALQEQVNTLLQAQSPVSQPLSTTPKVEASTSTGDSLYWPSTQSHYTPAHSTPSQPSLFTPTHSTPSQLTHHTPMLFTAAHSTPSRQEEESVCSSIVSGVSVETVTSILSQNVSDMHLDLHSYAHSPSPPQSPSFGESASVVLEQPLQASDPQQVYQNMLTTVNALLQCQEDTVSPSTDQVSAVSHASTQHSSVVASNQEDESTSHSTTLSVGSQSLSHSSSNSFDEEQNIETLSNKLSSHSKSTATTQLSQVSHKTQHVLTHPQEPSKDLPYLHPDIFQDHYGGGAEEVSLLPVPRIVGPVPSSNTTLDAVYSRGSSDTTLDDHMQLADRIAVKYLGRGKVSVEAQHQPRQPHLSGGDVSSLYSDSAQLSLATQQYLQRHHLLASNGSKPPPNTVLCKEPSPPLITQESQDNILNIRRLKQLPKLI